MTLFGVPSSTSHRNKFWFLSNSKKKSKDERKSKCKSVSSSRDCKIMLKINEADTESNGSKSNGVPREFRSNSTASLLKTSLRDEHISDSRKSLAIACGLDSASSTSSDRSKIHPTVHSFSKISATPAKPSNDKSSNKYSFLRRTTSVSKHTGNSTLNCQVHIANRNSLDLDATYSRRSRARKVR